MKNFIVGVILFFSILANPMIGNAFSTQESQDALSLVTKLKEMGYRFEAGMTWGNFSEIYNDMYVKQRIFREKYPDTPIERELTRLVQLYTDIKGMWDPSTHRYAGMVYRNEIQYLKAAYPGIEKEIPKDWLGNWNHYMDVVRNLLRRTNKLTDNVIQAYKNSYEQERPAVYGISFSNFEIGKPLTVTKIIPDSSAEKAGIVVGDVITAVNNNQISTLSADKFANFFEGPPGSMVRLDILRSEVALSVTLEKSVIMPKKEPQPTRKDF